MTSEPEKPPRPSHQAGDVVLRDGSTVKVRPLKPDDEHRLLEFFRSLSEESRWLRFFSIVKDKLLAAEAHREAAVDFVRTFGLIALTGGEERVIGHALYSAIGEDHADAAFAVADDYQGRGLGTMLVGQLAQIAAANGIQVFEADVLASNHKMIGVFRRSGFPIKVSVSTGQLHVTFPTSLTSSALEQFEQREQVSAVNALRLFLSPHSVAVIGASRNRGTIGGEIFHNLLNYEFAGPVYPVNPGAEVIQSVLAYPSVEAISGPLDLAVVAVPSAHVLQVAEDCGRKGVRALVVISAGFAETGDEGRVRQRELLRICRMTGMRLIGPNCMGIINTDKEVRLDATFAPHVPLGGRVGFFSQSGALGLAIIDYANSLGLGISSFISIGNKADISGNDLLSYWESDTGTDVILLYLESFGNPKKFSRLARRIGRKKPIVVVKSGRSTAGARAASSHTGALLAASEVTVDALFRQAGVIRTDTLEELFDVASLLATQPVPAGRRVGIVTNAGGPAILCADACEGQGLKVPMLDEKSMTELRAFLPVEASATNPVDMIASASAEDYGKAIAIVAADPNVDSLVVIFTPPLVTRAEDVARAIVDAVRCCKAVKPVVTVFLSARGVPDELKTTEVRIPSFAFPEAAANALARVAHYGEWREKPEFEPPRFDNLRRDEAAAIVATALGRGDGWLTQSETTGLLSCYGLPLVDQRVVPTPEEAGEAAEEFGGEVALKAIAADVLHKTEAGAVKLHLSGREQVKTAAEEMTGRLAAAGQTPTAFLVQKMVGGGVEMIVGIAHDPQFGPVVACGAGGVFVELMRDVSVRLTPLTGADASEMIRTLKTYPLLTGFRGSVACDTAALEDGLLRVSCMAEDLPQIAELDCNPFVVLEHGAVILDARVRVAASDPPTLLGARR